MAKTRYERKKLPWPLGMVRSTLSLVVSLLLGAVLLTAFGIGVYMLYLDAVIRSEFDEKRWAMPAKVYARPLELYESMALSANDLEGELRMLRYRDVNCPEVAPPDNSSKTNKRRIKRKAPPKPQVCTPPVGGGAAPTKPGSYARNGETFEIVTRDFVFWDQTEPSRRVRLTFAGNILVEMANPDAPEKLGLLRLDPPEIAGIYPSHYEDRILLKGADLPPALVDTLLAVEDRSFFEHAGVNPKGIFRAMVANVRAGRTVQGGSTITQQLVKNLFLSNERTFKRKINEVLMAIIIDGRYGKDEILEAYSNAIYLGQDGSRAIHGFGLASQFYFGQNVEELDLHQIALLVGMIKGPSLYDPRKYPERALERRSLVLDVMAEQNLISAEDAETAKTLALDVTPKTASGITAYPAFLDLVKRQLRQHYKSEDLLSEGLRVFTTLNPRTQAMVENIIASRIPELEKSQGRARPLQGAAIVTDTQNGEVLAMVGGREPKEFGFNRALDAKRLAGSLIKPVIYLTALEQPKRYTLLTLINDSPFTYRSGGQQWSPGNYDRRYHGRVALRDALARSYNIPAVRVGLDMDVINVIEMLRRLGFQRDLKPYPSLLLGAFEASPFEIAQVYAGIASGGLRMPLRAINQVTDSSGEPLQHYSLDVEKAVEPGAAYLITNAMQRVVTSGTASAVKSKLSPSLKLAGKTGTTNDYRDSWFAGFSGNRLTVVWLGRDDNKPTGLSGSSGALRVWIDLMANLALEPLDEPAPADITMARVGCGGPAVPFLIGSAIPRSSSCEAAPSRPKPKPAAPDSDDADAANDMSNFFQRLME